MVLASEPLPTKRYALGYISKRATHGPGGLASVPSLLLIMLATVPLHSPNTITQVSRYAPNCPGL